MTKRRSWLTLKPAQVVRDGVQVAAIEYDDLKDGETTLSGVAAYTHTHDGGASFPVGVIVLWHGLLINIPSGWALCDGTNGTPDLRDKFVKGAAAGANPGTLAGALTHTHAGHSAHVVTQPGDHAALPHSGAAVANHTITQPAAHSDHAAQAHSAHVGAAVANHTFTQPSGHSAHVVTQPSAHAALGTHAHELPFTKLTTGTGALRMLAQSIFGSGTSRAPESVSAAPTANTTAAAVALSQAISAGSPDAHVGAAVDAHSAHSGGGVDAHGVTQPSAHSDHAALTHSSHSGTDVSVHGVTQPSNHAAQSHSGAAVDAHSAHDSPNHEPPSYAVAFIMKT